MKKSIIFILILLVFPLVSSVEFEMGSNFSQGETLFAKVSGNFLDPILKENIFFYRGHVRSPTEFDVKKIEDEFYIYALLGEKSSNNYSIVIRDVRYMKGNQISKEEITANFFIEDKTADFSIEPGFIFTEDNFFLTVQNLQEKKITLYYKIKNETIKEKGFFESLFGGAKESKGESITLLSGEIKKINFASENLEKNKLIFIGLSTENTYYNVPVFLSHSTIIPDEKEKRFIFDPPTLNVSIPINSKTNRIVYLSNIGEETLENISLILSDSLKPYINLSTEKIEELKINSTHKIDLSIFSTEAKNLKGTIRARTGEENLFAYLEIDLEILKSHISPDLPITKTCSELNGTICNYNTEECDGETVNTKDAICCLGTCKEKKKSATGMIIGWIIIILILVFLSWFFFKKYRKTKRPTPFFFNPPAKKETPVRIIQKPITRIVEKPVLKEVVKKVFIEKQEKPEPKYTASSQAGTLHKSSCKFSKLIEPEYKVTGDDLLEFQKKGYKPCKVCLKD